MADDKKDEVQPSVRCNSTAGSCRPIAGLNQVYDVILLREVVVR